MKNFPSFLLIIITLSFVFPVQSQSNYYKAYDSIIGYNQTNLYNGLRYVDTYMATPDNHKFFDKHTFVPSEIRYDGQSYYDVNLKYDLLTDVVVLQPSGEKSFLSIELLKNVVDYFKMGNHEFYNLTDEVATSDLKFSGFFELLYSGTSVKLYSKHVKEVSERYKNRKINYIFNKSTYFFVEHNQQFYQVDSKKDFTRLFPNKEAQISTLYDDYKLLIKNNPTEFMKRLAAILDQSSSQ